MDLTNPEQSPMLSKAALLRLVDWVKKHHDRSVYIEIDKMGEHSPRESLSLNSTIRNNVIEKIAKIDNKYGESK